MTWFRVQILQSNKLQMTNPVAVENKRSGICKCLFDLNLRVCGFCFLHSSKSIDFDDVLLSRIGGLA